MDRKQRDKILADGRIAAGMCSNCGKNPLAVGRSKRICTECADAKKVRDSKRYQEGKKVGTSLWKHKEFKKKAVEAGFCRIHTSRKRERGNVSLCNACLARCAANNARCQQKKAEREGPADASPYAPRAGNGHKAVMKVKEVDGWWRASLGKAAWWGKTKDEAVERLMRKIGEDKAA